MLVQLMKSSISSLMLTMHSSVTDMNYEEILKVWNNETPDDFAIFSELYYEMFGEDGDIPYVTNSTGSSFFPFN